MLVFSLITNIFISVCIQISFLWLCRFYSCSWPKSWTFQFQLKYDRFLNLAWKKRVQGIKMQKIDDVKHPQRVQIMWYFSCKCCLASVGATLVLVRRGQNFFLYCIHGSGDYLCCRIHSMVTQPSDVQPICINSWNKTNWVANLLFYLKTSYG